MASKNVQKLADLASEVGRTQCIVDLGALAQKALDQNDQRRAEILIDACVALRDDKKPDPCRAQPRDKVGL